jgi:hypothetical protein
MLLVGLGVWVCATQTGDAPLLREHLNDPLNRLDRFLPHGRLLVSRQRLSERGREAWAVLSMHVPLPEAHLQRVQQQVDMLGAPDGVHQLPCGWTARRAPQRAGKRLPPCFDRIYPREPHPALPPWPE